MLWPCPVACTIYLLNRRRMGHARPRMMIAASSPNKKRNATLPITHLHHIYQPSHPQHFV
jgi:hypothetical protein